MSDSPSRDDDEFTEQVIASREKLNPEFIRNALTKQISRQDGDKQAEWYAAGPVAAKRMGDSGSEEPARADSSYSGDRAE